MSRFIKDDIDELPRDSVAIPPHYILRVTDRCPKCGEALHVYTLGCSAFVEAQEGHPPVEHFHFLHHVRSRPVLLLYSLRAKCPSYHFDYPGAGIEPCLMNHCRCGARIGDDHLHGNVGAAFWPDTPDGFARIRLFRLPVAEPIAVECSYTIGGGEYLDFDKAEPW